MSRLAASDVLMTVDDFFEFACARDSERWELVGGRPVMAPTEISYNGDAASELCFVLKQQLPRAWRASQTFSVRLHESPPTVRVPDVTLLRPEADLSRWWVSPSEVALVAEFLSPSTPSADLVTKRAEYAAAGIPNYLVVDLTDPGAPQLTLFNRIVDSPQGPRYDHPGGPTRAVRLHLGEHNIPVRHSDLAIS